MDNQNPPTIRAYLNFLILTIVGGVVAMVLYDHVVRPAYQVIPLMPGVIYAMSQVIIASLYLCAIAIVLGISVNGVRKYLANREYRTAVHDHVRRWPNSKWSLLPVIAVTWLTAATAIVMALLLLTPRESLAGIMSVEQVLMLMVVAFGSPAVIYLPVLIREIYKGFSEVRRQWPSRKHREKVVFTALMSIVVMAWLVVMVGDFVR